MSIWFFNKKITLSELPIFCIKIYQNFISPSLGEVCPFYPSCSFYAYEAFKKHGLLIGLFMSAERYMRDHPFKEIQEYRLIKINKKIKLYDPVFANDFWLK